MLRFLGNLLWFVFIGLISGLMWLLAGVILCVTVIGIPLGLQCFKMAGLSFLPFGKRIVYNGQMFSFLVNVLWILIFGWELALYYVAMGLICCVTIVAIPAGLQCFKMAQLALMPFGATVESL